MRRAWGEGEGSGVVSFCGGGRAQASDADARRKVAMGAEEARRRETPQAAPGAQYDVSINFCSLRRSRYQTP